LSEVTCLLQAGKTRVRSHIKNKLPLTNVPHKTLMYQISETINFFIEKNRK